MGTDGERWSKEGRSRSCCASATSLGGTLQGWTALPSRTRRRSRSTLSPSRLCFGTSKLSIWPHPVHFYSFADCEFSSTVSATPRSSLLKCAAALKLILHSAGQRARERALLRPRKQSQSRWESSQQLPCARVLPQLLNEMNGTLTAVGLRRLSKRCRLPLCRPPLYCSHHGHQRSHHHQARYQYQLQTHHHHIHRIISGRGRPELLSQQRIKARDRKVCMISSILLLQRLSVVEAITWRWRLHHHQLIATEM
mmetsp:Transcript_33683/g.70875  ORF Transcript_33683/g.70875 Transcript_33683/m.70875 type:complete len:253 (-) Transcript_33683:370-1128(-)